MCVQMKRHQNNLFSIEVEYGMKEVTRLFFGGCRLKLHQIGVIKKGLSEIKREKRCNKQWGSGWNPSCDKAVIKDNLRTTGKI